MLREKSSSGYSSSLHSSVLKVTFPSKAYKEGIERSSTS